MSASSELNGKLLITQMVNSLAAKMQIGSPMASMYLLGHPDHYMNLAFRVCWWKSSKNIVGATAVDDYVHCPNEYSQCSVYEYIQVSTRCKRTRKQVEEFMESLKEASDTQQEDSDSDDDWIEHDLPRNAGSEALNELRSYPFRKDHPLWRTLWRTHYIKCDRRNINNTVPNFIGESLPRKDQGDREYYCRMMLTLFKPWCDGKDLKTEEETWNDSFTRYAFSDDQIRVMKNFNLRYECNDARDDYSSLDRSKKNSFSILTTLETSSGDDEVEVDIEQAETDFKSFLEQISPLKGPNQISKDAQMTELENVLVHSGWIATFEKVRPVTSAVFNTRLSGKKMAKDTKAA
ncbi:hypothetical protein C8R45DRAFT_848557 [Mycena sanguinolenta]|nr:hypothetical protein C8R45DRAFT_848557 [Mycena sanguinolenta]